MTAGTTAASTVTITDDDVPSVTVSFGAATYSVAEDGTVDVTVTLDVAPEREVTIPLTKTDQGGIVSEDDYSGVPESVTFGAAETEKSFTFTAARCDDDVDDDDESVSITDDDVPAVTVSFGAATYTADEGGTVDVTVTLDMAPVRR